MPRSVTSSARHDPEFTREATQFYYAPRFGDDTACCCEITENKAILVFARKCADEGYQSADAKQQKRANFVFARAPVGEFGQQICYDRGGAEQAPKKSSF